MNMSSMFLLPGCELTELKITPNAKRIGSTLATSQWSAYLILGGRSNYVRQRCALGERLFLVLVGSLSINNYH